MLLSDIYTAIVHPPGQRKHLMDMDRTVDYQLEKIRVVHFTKRGVLMVYFKVLLQKKTWSHVASSCSLGI